MWSRGIVANILVSFHMWSRGIVLEREKVYDYFAGKCLKNFLSVFTSFKMHGNSRNGLFLVKEESKRLSKYCPAAIGIMFSKKYVRDTKLQNSALWNISHLDLCFNSIADDTSLFLVVHDVNQSGINLNDDLQKISNWAFQWNMSFNPDIKGAGTDMKYFERSKFFRN